MIHFACRTEEKAFNSFSPLASLIWQANAYSYFPDHPQPLFMISSISRLFTVRWTGSLLFFACLGSLSAQSVQVPRTHHNIISTEAGLVLKQGDESWGEVKNGPAITLEAMYRNIKGTKKGLKFDFGSEGFNGRLYYGFIPYGDSKHPHPVWFKRFSIIEAGKAEIDIQNQLKGRYDMVQWAEKGYGTLGYRVMTDDGSILYDGKVHFTGTGPFEAAPTIIEGPFVNLLGANSLTISFTTNEKVKPEVKVGDQVLTGIKKKEQHEFAFEGLSPATEYSYTVTVGSDVQSYTLRTAPVEGSREAFTFAYASDSRSGQGGGERDIYGANAYIMKKIMALAMQEDIRFFQFSGDLINGYLTQPAEINLQYANWKRAIEPFAHYFPVYVSQGNHEALSRAFASPDGKKYVTIDRFPYATESAEAIFGDNFVLPTNGPESEDGAVYDPRPKKPDFPSYKENVYHYRYDNVAVVVMNSDYWYTPNQLAIPTVGGGLHGYIMDQQLAWLKETIASLEADASIDHIFITQHTPFFPNGGHVGDDMWYRGNNEFRPWVAGKPVAKGIIERRDQLLDIVVNQSQKVAAIFTGDEHNYARTEIGPETNIYPADYPSNQKIKLSRTIYQVNNGAAGAPYYAQEETPWTPFVSGFTTQNALVIFHVAGKKLSMVVKNPDTLEEVDQLIMRE